MTIRLTTMTREQFQVFYQWSADQQIRELMADHRQSQQEATANAMAELAQMLPQGLFTPHNYLMTITDADSGESLGFLWMLHEEFEGRKQCFLCDLALWEAHRRKGFATQALHLAEDHAATAGCREMVLFVRDDNAPARALYQACGYTFLRQRDTGKYMKKPLPQKKNTMKNTRVIDKEITLVPYYPNYKTALAWYQDLELCKQVDNRDHPYDRNLLKGMYNYLNTHGDLFYIKYKNRLCGDVCLQPSGEVNIVIAKPFQNKHIGRRAMAGIIQLAREKGISQLHAEIYAFNTQSQKMFLSLGFTQTGDEQYTLCL